LLKNTGLLANKHVPDAYFRSSYQQRLDLLRGLLDTDGSIDATGRVEFSNTNEHLAQAVVELVASLGLRSRWRVQPSKIGHLPLHRVGFCTGLPVFTIRRKVERLVPPRSSEHGFRYIVDVQPTESVPVRCIAVDNDDHLFLVGRTLVPTHNSGILALSPPDFMPQYVPSIRKVIWPNSTVAITFSSESPDQLRGPQSHFTWADELAAFKLSRSDVNAWEQITISTRLGEHPQIFVTTTPKRIPLIRELVDRAQQPESDVLIVTGSTYDNRANLSSEYLQTLIDLYAGTALEEQELYGRLVLVVEGSLWKDRDFVIAPLPPGWNIPDKMAHDIFGPNKPEFVTVIGVDPSASSGGDETGIVRVQTTRQRDEHISQRRAWVTADRSVQGPPEQWAKAVADLYHESNEDHLTVVVAEKNQGGEMVRTVIQSADPAIPVALIPSVKSKAARAEPVVLAYRRGRVFHTEDFPELTGQLTEWEPSSKWSPDRLDALVHAVTAVLIDDRPLRPYSRMTIASLDDTRLLDGVNSRARQETRSMNLGSWRGRQTAPVIHDPAEYFR
jgi:phage terminase large subunit-like protein